MADNCINTLLVKAPTDGARIELKEFVNKSSSFEKEFSLNSLYPMPHELDFQTRSGTKLESENVHTQEDEALEIFIHAMLKGEEINTYEELVQYLTKNNLPNIELGQIAYENLQKYGAMDWYHWRIKNWGVKWDAFDPLIIKNNGFVFKVEFETPWDPPVLWLKKISKDFPNLNFSLKYRCNGISELIKIKNGILANQ